MTSISGEGGKEKRYRHHCPLPDFKLLAQAARQACSERGFYTKRDLQTAAERVKLMPSGLAFRPERHDYKIALTAEYLVAAGAARRLDGREGRYIRYEVSKGEGAWNRWLQSL